MEASASFIRWSTAPVENISAAELQVNIPIGLDSFGALRALLLAAAAGAGREIDTLVVGHEKSLSLTLPDILGIKQGNTGHFYNAENVGSSVIRRISRESIHLTDAIDDLAILLLDVTAQHGDGLRLICAEHLDRPSARVLYRAYQLADPGRIRWTWHFSHAVLANPTNNVTNEIERRYRDSRYRLFHVLAERMNVQVVEDDFLDLPTPIFSPAALL